MATFAWMSIILLFTTSLKQMRRKGKEDSFTIIFHYNSQCSFDVTHVRSRNAYSFVHVWHLGTGLTHEKHAWYQVMPMA